MRQSDFVGRWKILDTELDLCADGSWKLKHKTSKLSWFKTINQNEGRWMYALRNLGFARTDGGVGMRIRIIKINRTDMIVAGPGGDEVQLTRLPTQG